MEPQLIEADNPAYPAVLRDFVALDPVPRLWMLGNPEILDRNLLGLFCSNRCPGELIIQLYDLARGLRDAAIPVISGFHTSLEREALDFLLRGSQPLVICPARSIQAMRLPGAWRVPLDKGRLLILSPFEASHRRPTAELAWQRNRLVAALAREVLVVHASPTGSVHRLCDELSGLKQVSTLPHPDNAHLIQSGIPGQDWPALATRLQRNWNPQKAPP